MIALASIASLVAVVALVAAWNLRGRLAAEHDRSERLAFELRRATTEFDTEAEASRDRFENLARVASVGFFEADTNGDVVYVSEKVAAMLGRARVESLGARWLESVIENDRDRVKVAWRTSLLERRQFAVEFRTAASDAGAEWVYMQATPFVEATGNVAQIAGTMADVSERRRLEDHLRESQRIESLALLAGGVAHDFNNLLVGVLGNAGILKGRLPSDSPLRDLVEQMEIAALRGSDLARKMLNYSGQGVVTLEAVDLCGLVDEMARLLEARAPGIRVEHVEDRRLSIEADPVQIRQVVLNLVVNAAESYEDPPGRVLVRTRRRSWPGEQEGEVVVLAPSEATDFAVVEVEDSGVGIDEAGVRSAFDPFFTTKLTGRGLGLAVVLGVVRGHGGGISLRSSPGEGMKLTTWFPAVPYSDEATTKPTEPAAADTSFAGRRVLVVDDECTVVDTIERLLRDLGAIVVTAPDGFAGIEAVTDAHDPFDVCLLDLTMPRLTSRKTFDRMREIDPHLPVVLVSGYARADALGRFGGDDLSGYLQKPFRSEELEQVLNGAVRQRA